MTPEQKVIAYDNAIDKAKALYKAAEPMSGCNVLLETIFPELRESEDEKSKKWILEYLYDGLRKSDEQFKEQFKCAIAWLEKQGGQTLANSAKTCKDEQKPIKVSYTTIVETGNGGVNTVVERELSVDGCYGKQEPFGYENANIQQNDFAPKIEPKFKVGDWVVFKNKHQSIYQVEKIEDGYYILRHTHGGTLRVCELHDESLRLWTIQQDAKNGDVVVDKSDGTIGIFKSIGHHPDGGSFNDHSYCFLHCRYDDGYFYADFENGNTISSYDAIPATKEQRDLLFKKMKDAGYEWDAEKKELKKQEIAEIPFGAKDSELQEITYCIPKGFHAVLDGNKVVIKKGEQKSAWSEEDTETLNGIVNYLFTSTDVSSIEGSDKWYDWLKSLKNRVIPKQEWSEEDEQYLLVCKNALAKYQASDKWDAEIISCWLENKLKALQNTWKPSDEQMKALHDLNLTGSISYTGQGQALIELYKDIKKL